MAATIDRPVQAPFADELETFAQFCSLLKLEDGSPFILEPFQRRMMRDFFDGCVETLILIPKKNGKSTLLSALALFHLVTTPDAECVIAASSRDQAAIMMKQATGFVRRSPDLQERVVTKQREITCPRFGGRIRILASDEDTADGVIPTLALVDELHRHKSAGMYGIFRDGLGPRQGRMITISTAGDDEASPLGVMRKAALALAGLRREDAYTYARKSDGTFCMHEWSLDPKSNLQDLNLVKKANPASWQTKKALKIRRDSPSMAPWQWARFACGVWMSGENTAINPVEWSACGDSGVEIPEGEGILIGLDLGWKWDTSAIVPVWIQGNDENRKFTIGNVSIVTPPRDGTSTPEEDIIEPILELAKRYRIVALVFDRNAGGQQLAQRLEREHGFDVIDHSQDPAPMAEAADVVYTAIRSKRLKHPENPTLTAHVLAAVKRTTSGEKWRFIKHRRAIDGVIAMAMAMHEGTRVVDEEPLIAWH